MNISSSLATSVYLLGATLSPLPLAAQETTTKAALPMTKESVPALKAAAQAGDAEAQYRLGMLHILGLYVPTDYKQTFTWLEKAAQQGHVYAQYELGSFYHPNKELFVIRDSKKANDLFAKALPRLQKMADQGDAYALRILADMYNRGKGVKEDKKKAEQLMLKALPSMKALAEKGDLNAQSLLATLMMSGIPIPDAEVISLPYLKKLGDQGSSTAKTIHAGYVFQKGQVEEAIALARQAVSNNCPMAAMILVTLHYHGPIKASDEELLIWLELMENQYIDVKALFPDDEYPRLKALKKASPASK